MSNPVDPSVDIFVKTALGKKPINLVVLDLQGLSSVADVFLICSGRSSRQVKAIAEHIKVELKKQRIKPLSVEGMNEGHWVLMDYGHVIIHIFYHPVRSFYDLEGLWVDAERVTTESMKNMVQAETDDQFDPDFNGDDDE